MFINHTGKSAAFIRILIVIIEFQVATGNPGEGARSDIWIMGSFFVLVFKMALTSWLTPLIPTITKSYGFDFFLDSVTFTERWGSVEVKFVFLDRTFHRKFLVEIINANLCGRLRFFTECKPITKIRLTQNLHLHFAHKVKGFWVLFCIIRKEYYR